MVARKLTDSMKVALRSADRPLALFNRRRLWSRGASYLKIKHGLLAVQREPREEHIEQLRECCV
jgi:hypothetical protein